MLSEWEKSILGGHEWDYARVARKRDNIIRRFLDGHEVQENEKVNES